MREILFHVDLFSSGILWDRIKHLLSRSNYGEDFPQAKGIDEGSDILGHKGDKNIDSQSVNENE